MLAPLLFSAKKRKTHHAHMRFFLLLFFLQGPTAGPRWLLPISIPIDLGNKLALSGREWLDCVRARN